MFETQRVILGGGMEVGEREVTSVASLGEQREIGQPEFRGQFAAHALLADPLPREPPGVGEASEKKDDQQPDDRRCPAGRTQTGSHRALRMATRRSSAGAP